MEFDQLKGFYYVSRLRSFTAAAGKLFLTQPAVSLQIKALEQELGEKLFERGGRRVALTAAGEALFRLAEEIVGKLDEVRVVMNELRNLERGRFSLGTSDTTSLYFIPELIREFRRAHPKIEIQIHNRISQEIVRSVVDGEVDLGIVSLPLGERRLEVRPLHRHRLTLVVARDHPFAGRKVVRPSDLSGEPMIALERTSTTQSRIDAYLRDHGVAPRTVIELGSFEIIKKFVAIGLGVALVPECAVERKPDGVEMIPLSKAPPPLELGAIHRKDRFLSQSARAFLALAVEHFRGLRRAGDD